MASADDNDHPPFYNGDGEDYDDDDFEEEEDYDATMFNVDAFAAASDTNPNLSFSSFDPPVPPENGAVEANAAPVHEQKFAPFDDSRRLFQRLWTDEDEIVILEGFLDFVTKRGTTHANYQHDTGPFYEQIKHKINLDFNKNQLVEKIRRLKKKFRTLDAKMNSMGQDFSFKSAHEKARYEISRQIWSTTFKRPSDRKNHPESHALGDSVDRVLHQEIPVASKEPETNSGAMQSCFIPSVVEETVKCCLSPLLKELLQIGIGRASGGSFLDSLPLSLFDGAANLPKGLVADKWRDQHILELEVYLKRVELLEEHIKATLEELRSSSPKTVKTED